MKRTYWLATGGLAVLVVVLAVVALFYAKAQPTTEPALLPSIAADETDPAVFGKYYPRHYDSYLKNSEMSNEDTVYGGSVPRDHLAETPYQKILWAGYGFSKEYNEDRGHVYTMEDVTKIKRVTEKTRANCLTCKSGLVPKMIEKYGQEYWNKPFKDLVPEAGVSISCSDCHDPKSMELRITRPSLVEAFQRQGRDITKVPQQEMRTLVCAQCHVEYYFEPGANKVIFPWDKGTDPEQIYSYYQEIKFKDWEHATSKTPALKAQHPEYEMFQGSTHQSAGLSCADCHMPTKKEGTTKITSHWWTSPLKTMTESCATCHREDMTKLKNRVLYTQDKTADLLRRAGETNAQAIAAIDAAANTPGVDMAMVDKARGLHREAQWYWDYVAAENSTGFHNPQKAMATLGKAIDLAHQAKSTVEQAKAAAPRQ